MLSSTWPARPEDELLLCCARTSRTPEVAARIRTLLGTSIDWEYLIRTAHAHGVVQLLYWHLGSACPEAVPKNAMNYLQENFRANSLHNLALTGELLELLNAFRAHRIPAVPYRGPVLTAFAYPNIALRRFVDLDIMVHRKDVIRAKELLTSLGYRPRDRLTVAQEKAFLRSRFDYIFIRDDSKSIVELHWDISEHFSYPIDSQRLWGGLEQVRLGNELAPTFSPEDTLLMLCAHGSKHLWERLAWICDVAELIRAHQDMKWQEVLGQAKALGSERMLLIGLLLASDLLGAPLPNQVLGGIEADTTVRTVARRIYERLFQEANYRPELFKQAHFNPLHLKMKERLPDKVRFCVRVVTTQAQEDWAFLPLPDFLFPLYYVLRPIRLTSKYALRMAKRLF